MIGTLAVARAEPDGHTLVLGTNQTHATNQSLLKNCPYDAVDGFRAVAGIADIPHVLVVRQGLEVAGAGALVAAAKATPDELQLRFDRRRLGLASCRRAVQEPRRRRHLQHIPFRGAAPMMTELLAGRIDVSFATLPSVIAQIDAGELQALAVASARRAARLPKLPTLAEARHRRRRGRRLVRAVRAGDERRRPRSIGSMARSARRS